MSRSVDFNLYLITDRHQVPDGDLPRAVALALEGGVRAVQLREKDLAGDERKVLATELRTLTRRYRARLLINSDLDLVLETGADGVHLTSSAPDIAGTRYRLGPERLIGLSTHHLDEVLAAQAAGADFVTFGPVYPTPSKLAYGDPAGLPRLAEVCRSTTLPVFALGGIHPRQLSELQDCGCRRIALISAILAAPDPARAARQLLARLSA